MVTSMSTSTNYSTKKKNNFLDQRVKLSSCNPQHHSVDTVSSNSTTSCRHIVPNAHFLHLSSPESGFPHSDRNTEYPTPYILSPFVNPTSMRSLLPLHQVPRRLVTPYKCTPAFGFGSVEGLVDTTYSPNLGSTPISLSGVKP